MQPASTRGYEEQVWPASSPPFSYSLSLSLSCFISISLLNIHIYIYIYKGLKIEGIKGDDMGYEGKKDR